MRDVKNKTKLHKTKKKLTKTHNSCTDLTFFGGINHRTGFFTGGFHMQSAVCYSCEL